MEFVQNIGERYLLGKANAVPQQLENLAKKQLKGDDVTPKVAPTAQDVGQEKEIEELRKELAEAKLGREKQGKESKPSKDSKPMKENSRKSQSVAGSVTGRSSRSKHAPHAHSKPTERTHKNKAAEAHETPRRGRSDSIKTAIAARPHSANPVKFGEVHYSRSDHNALLGGKAPEMRHRDLQTMGPKATANNHADRGEQVHKIIQSTRSEQPRPAADFCVVEVTEDEPLRRRRRRNGRANFVEVIERDSNRTKYVIR